MAKTILLADDSLTIQKVIELTFAETELDVIATSSGDELLEKLASTSPDIVICDTIMPGRDGYEVCQKIKSDSSTLHIPVILLTGTFEPFDRDRALAAGCSEIVTKPFEARRLVETVERLAAGDAGPATAAIDEGPEATPSADFDGVMPPPPGPEGDVEDLGAATVQLGPAPVDEMPTPEDAPSDAPEDEEGLEFTSPAFDEMDAPAEEAPQPDAEEVSDESIEFEMHEPEDHHEAVPLGDGSENDDTQPVPVSEPPLDEPHSAFESPDEPEPFDDGPFEVADEAHDESAEIAQIESLQEPAELAPAVQPESDEQPEAAELPTPETADPGESFAEAETGPETEAETETETWPEPETAIETEVDTETEVAVAPPEPESPPTEGNIDTAPVGPPEGDTSRPVGMGQLSDADVERIARRVAELAADRLEQIAWDVIPDMAEIVVRERIRELERDFEQQNLDNQTN